MDSPISLAICVMTALPAILVFPAGSIEEMCLGWRLFLALAAIIAFFAGIGGADQAIKAFRKKKA
jgi:hypothetical protein